MARVRYQYFLEGRGKSCINEKNNIRLKCNSQSSPFVKQALQRMREMKLKKNMENDKSKKCQVIEYSNFRV